MARPEVAVVVATHDRARRVGELVESLRRQTLEADRFEAVFVDDGSTDDTVAVLERERERGGLNMQVIALPDSAGPSRARNRGWRASSAPLVAFTDDDCLADPGWLEGGLRACAAHAGAVVQGRVDPRPDELDQWGPFSRTHRIHQKGPYYQTANMFYPREVLERLGGFDEIGFPGPSGEDADLAWRAIEEGVATEFADGARVYESVERLGPVGKLRVAGRWTEMVRMYAAHPGLRREHLVHGIFWKKTHELLVRLIVAALLPRRMALAKGFLAYPYLRHLPARGRVEGGGLKLAPYFLLHDLVELVAVVRGALRYRILVL